MAYCATSALPFAVSHHTLAPSFSISNCELPVPMTAKCGDGRLGAGDAEAGSEIGGEVADQNARRRLHVHALVLVGEHVERAAALVDGDALHAAVQARVGELDGLSVRRETYHGGAVVGVEAVGRVDGDDGDGGRWRLGHSLKG